MLTQNCPANHSRIAPILQVISPSTLSQKQAEPVFPLTPIRGSSLSSRRSEPDSELKAPRAKQRAQTLANLLTIEGLAMGSFMSNPIKVLLSVHFDRL